MNKTTIEQIFESIKQTAPEGALVDLDYFGYISIVLPNRDYEIALGDEGLEVGYAWNDTDNRNMADLIPDLDTPDEIVKLFWAQLTNQMEAK